MSDSTLSGPLLGLRVVEFSGLGPAPHCAMLLADQGAEVLRIARAGDPMVGLNPVVERGRSTITLDLRSAEGRDQALTALDHADVLIEGFRPGVMERLGLGPDHVLQRNPRLVYGRMTGWGQTGPLAKTAGHDINYIAITGALDAFGEADGAPSPPLNLVGDYGGGSLYLAFGIVSALLERERSGQGQVIDAAVVDGSASLMALFMGLLPQGLTDLQRGKNLLGGGAHFYRCYRCADGRFISVGALEPQFYEQLLDRIAAPDSLRPDQDDTRLWDGREKVLTEIFAGKTRDEWCAVLEGTDACFAPVLSADEAPHHDHLKDRQTFVDIDGFQHPAPAPRFSRTNGAIPSERPAGDVLLERWLKGPC